MAAIRDALASLSAAIQTLSARVSGVAPSISTPAIANPLSGATRWQPGQLNVGINWEGLDELGGRATPDFVRVFHDLDDMRLSAQERQLVAQGSTLFTSIKGASNTTGRDVPWADIANGAIDGELRTYLAELKANGGEHVLFSFNHEPDSRKNAHRGTPQEFVAAWRRIHDLADEMGVSTKAGGNVEFVWTMVGWGFETGRVGSYYPGDAYVDYVGTDPYDTAKSGERRSFAEATRPTIEWMAASGVDKPVIVAETGTPTRSAPTSSQQWIQQMLFDLRTDPTLSRIVGVSYWSNQTPGSPNAYMLDAAAATAYAAAM